MPSDTSARALWSLATLKDYLSQGSDVTNDPLVIQIGNSVTARLESATGRQIVARSYVETWFGDDRWTKALRFVPITSFASLTRDGITLDPLTYRVDLVGGYLTLLGACFSRCSQFVATYTAGFGTRDDQDSFGEAMDLFEAGLEQVKAIFDERKAGAVAASSISIGGSSFLLKPSMAYNIKDVLTRWRDMRA